MTAGTAFVVDASVGVKVILTEPHSERAEALLQAAIGEGSSRLLVPDLFFPEVANALAKAVRSRGFDPAQARRELAVLTGLGLTTVESRSLAAAGLRLALSEGFTAYDGCYLALSDHEGIPLVTADRWLWKRSLRHRHQVLWIGDL